MAGTPEEWKAVPGWEGWYAASSLGQIRRVCPGRATYAGRIRHGDPNRSGYLRMHLRQPGRHENRLVHELVALAFLGPKPEGHFVNHKNLIKSDNRLENLEYLTHLENMRHFYRNGQRKSIAGKRNGRAKLTDKQVVEIRRLYAAGGISTRALGARYGVNGTQIGMIVNRKHWKHI